MTDLVIFGTGKAAQAMKFYFEWAGTHRVVAFTVDEAFLSTDSFEDRPVVAWERLERFFPPKNFQLFAPIGYTRLNRLRQERFLEGRSRGYRFATFIHPAATCYGTPAGENSQILEGSFVQPYTRIGENVMSWGHCAFGHHSLVGDHCFITTSVLHGGTTIGARSFLSMSTIAAGVTIGEDCVIARGANVVQDVPANSIVLGAPNVVSKVPSGRLRL